MTINQRGGIAPLVDPQGFDPTTYFPEFYNNPTIQELGKYQKWSISNNNKMPIDMFKLRFENDPTRGASPFEPTSMVTLDELTQLLPTASNCAYHLDYALDGVVILDIEKTCPDDLKEKFLNIPYLYGEVSMSGKGIHLVIPTPFNLLKQNPASLKASKMQHPDKYFEILMTHWVTFTRNTKPLPPSTGTESVEKLLHDVVMNQRDIIKDNLVIGLDAPEGEKYDEYIDLALKHFAYTKQPENFNNDMSRYEFGFMSSLGIFFKNMMNFKQEALTDTELAWMMARVAEVRIPAREKHQSKRNGLPWLVYTAQEALAALAISARRED